MDDDDICWATGLYAMDLNNIKLDVKHTVLTPEYLENLIRNKNSEDSTNTQKN